MKTLYPEITPYQTFFLETQSQHAVYVELSGNPDGIPVLFLHGGPCSGTKPDHRRFFDPAYYRIILMDQRGCGQSTPFGELEHNTTSDLITDMEQIRVQLHIPQWLLFGGSWGATLALLYAQQYSDRVSGLILRGSFLARQQDMNWFLNAEGVGLIFPEQWQRLAASTLQQTSEPLLHALYNALWSEDELAQRRVAREWSAWSAQVALAQAYQADVSEHVTEKTLKQVRMEMHYAYHSYFIHENQILAHCASLQHLPITIIHGRLDLVCPVEAAMRLHQALPHAEYIVLPDAGHIAQGEAMIDALVAATDRFVLLLSQPR